MKNIAIIGSGSFGCALANYLSNKGNIVKVWSYKEEECNIINSEHICVSLENSKLNEKIKCYTNYEEVINNSEYIFLVTPSQSIREVCKNMKRFVSNQRIIIASKGLEKDTNKFLFDVVKEELPNNIVGILSGPSHAEEVINEMPTNVVFASKNDEFMLEIQNLFKSDNFSIEITRDLVGASLAGSLKNVIALAAGILFGLGYSSNIEAALITKGLKEIQKIGISMGGEKETFYGLSGLGDLIVTCTSDNSRNRKAGILLSKNKTIEEVKEEVGMVIEGLENLEVAKTLIDKYNIDCPIINSIYEIVYENKEPNQIVNSILNN